MTSRKYEKPGTVNIAWA